MKKFLFQISVSFIFSFLFTVNGFSQCKAEKDAFSGKMVINYKFNDSFSYSVQDSAIFFSNQFSYLGEFNAVAKAGTKFYFKLTNGEIIEFTSISDSQPVSEISGTYIYSRYTFRTILSRENLEKLTTSEVEVQRFPDLKGGFIDSELKGLKKKFAKKINEGAICIKENLK